MISCDVLLTFDKSIMYHKFAMHVRKDSRQTMVSEDWIWFDLDVQFSNFFGKYNIEF